MEKDLADRMETQRKRLQIRARDTHHQDEDKSMILMSLAHIFEALQELDRNQQRLAERLSRQ
jgi:hypothetical protein